jgi:hypothetical protein
MRTRIMTMAVALAMAGVTTIAQDKPAPTPPEEKPPAATPAPRERAEPVPLKVTFVLSRHKGDKKISSLPYVLGVASNTLRTTLRMAVQVPVATAVFGQQVEGKSIPQTSYQYRDVGTNIDCMATALPGGVYQLVVTVEDSSLQLQADPAQKDTQVSSRTTEMPAFRSFKSSFAILLKDGQTTQYTSATDPVSGEVVKIDLTLNVIK